MAVAEFERAIIQERVTAALKVAKARAAKHGRPDSLSQHQKVVQDLVAQGKSLRTIIRLLNLPLGSVHKVAKNGKA